MSVLGTKPIMQVTEADVIDAAIKQFEKPGGFTHEFYFRGKGLSVTTGHGGPSERVTATCAIGGVEQAVWQMTGRVVDETSRELIAVRDNGIPAEHGRPRHLVIYQKVMNRVNRIARDLYPEDPTGDSTGNVEDITLWDDGDTDETVRRRARTRVLRVFRAARAEVT